MLRLLFIFRNLFSRVLILLSTAAIGASPLHEIIQNGNVSDLINALDRGADANGLDENGQSLLFQAAIAKKIDMVRVIVERGVNLEVRDRYGFTVENILEAKIRRSGKNRLLMIDAMKKQGLTEVQIAHMLGPEYDHEIPGHGEQDRQIWQSILEYLKHQPKRGIKQ